MGKTVLEVLFLLIGFALLLKGADYLVDGASGIARKLKISPFIIGATVVALGTSAPELAVSIIDGVAGQGNIIAGNVLGSNIINALLILGIAAVSSGLPVEKASKFIDLPFLILVYIVFIVSGVTGWAFTWWEGLILVLLYAAFMAYNVLSAVRQSKKAGKLRLPLATSAHAAHAEHADSKPQGGAPSGDMQYGKIYGDMPSKDRALPGKRMAVGMAYAGEASGNGGKTAGSSPPLADGPQGRLPARKRLSAWHDRICEKTWVLVLLVIAGLALIVAGADFVVSSAEYIAEELFHIPTEIIALTVVALGTSLPEFMTSVEAMRHGNASLATGNIIGSNIANILLIGGVGILSYSGAASLAFSNEGLVGGIIGLAATALILLFSLGRKKTIGRAAGAVMLCCFAAYYTFLFLNLFIFRLY